jgi:parallel beta-helix repeat protein
MGGGFYNPGAPTGSLEIYDPRVDALLDRVTALEGEGVPGDPVSWIPGGPAGGDLGGFYPNPTVPMLAVLDSRLDIIEGQGGSVSIADISALDARIDVLESEDDGGVVVGGTLTADALGTFAVGSYSGLPTLNQADNVSMTTGMKILLVAETDSKNNGLWSVAAGAWSRPPEYAVGSDVSGALVVIKGGDNNGGTVWALNGPSPRTVDTQGTTWVPIRQPNYRGLAAQFSIYYPGDIVMLGQMKALLKKGATGGTGGFISSANYTVLEYLTHWDARDFGALSSAGGSETAIAAALTAANGSGTGGTVKLPSATIMSGATLAPREYTTLEGDGMMSTLMLLADNVNASVIKPRPSTGAGDPNAAFSAIRKLGINGRKAGQTAGHGIEFVTNPLTSGQTGVAGGNEWFDQHNIIEDVAVRSCKQDGVNLTGRSAHSLRNVWVDNCDRYGFSLTFDTNLMGCEASVNGDHGFVIQNGSCRLSTCKSYLNGWSTHTGAGYYLTNNANGCDLSSCNAQNNEGPGFLLDGCHDCTIHGSADGNGKKSAGAATAAVVVQNGAKNNILHIACENTPQGGAEIGDQDYALKIMGATTRGNWIELTCTAIAPANILGLIDPASDGMYGNTIIINGSYLWWMENGKVVTTGTAAPTTGTWAVGDRVMNSAPAASGNIGWVCTTAGTPGTWKTFGAISA